jgi:hypothetical protein
MATFESTASPELDSKRILGVGEIFNRHGKLIPDRDYSVVVGA